MEWYRIVLTDSEYEGGEAGILQRAFEEIFFASNGPSGMALYGQWADERRHYQVYFTPVAAARAKVLIDAYSGHPCDAPDRQSIEFIFGREPLVAF